MHWVRVLEFLQNYNYEKFKVAAPIKTSFSMDTSQKKGTLNLIFYYKKLFLKKSWKSQRKLEKKQRCRAFKFDKGGEQR